MSKTFFKTVLGLLAVVATTWSVSAAPVGMKTLSGHVPAVVSKLTPMGDLSGETNLQLALELPLRNTDALTNLLQQIYDPSSPNYHHYLSTEEFTEQFGPTEEDYQKVKDFATANGLTISATHPNRMVLDVTGKASDVERAFSVTLRTYHHPTESRDFYAPNVDPSVPVTLPIQEVGGLDNYRRPYTKFRLKPSNRKPTAAVSHVANAEPSPAATTGSGPGGDYIGNDFRTAYVPGTSLNGSNQSIALVQFDGYLASDIAEYESLAGRTNIPLQNVLIDGFNGSPTGNGGEDEVSLDIEMSVSMAPALAKIILYEGNPTNFLPNDVLNRIATDNSARQVSCSWGWSGGPSLTTDQIFEEMALQGQTFFDAVGDSCAFTPGANSVNGVDNPFVDNAPSDSPYITQVGGTTLTMSGPASAYGSETVWNWGVRFGSFEDGVGSSGGISSHYPIPSWQTNISMAGNQGSATFRNTPDVAMTADDVFVIADNGTEYEGFGGTSCASPLWAGFTALINQEAASINHAPVGFVNPALYALANGTSYTNYFHDVTTGNNEWSDSPSQFSAVTGYDLCTGLGSPNGTNLINKLAGVITVVTNPFVPILSAPAGPWGNTLGVLNGSDPNGPWFLFVQDDTALNAGIISNGWFVTLTTGNPVGNAADNEIYAAPTNVPTFLAVGSYWNLSLSVTNYGPSSSTNVTVSDTLPFSPGGIALASNGVTVGSATVSGYNVTWNLGNLPINTGGTMNLSFYLSADGVYTNSATVDAFTGDPNPDDNTIVSVANVAASVPPSLTGILPAGSSGHFTFAVGGTPGTTVVIQASTNLVNWVPIYTNVAPFEFTDLNTTNVPDRFYRAVSE